MQLLSPHKTSSFLSLFRRIERSPTVFWRATAQYLRKDRRVCALLVRHTSLCAKGVKPRKRSAFQHRVECHHEVQKSRLPFFVPLSIVELISECPQLTFRQWSIFPSGHLSARSLRVSALLCNSIPTVLELSAQLNVLVRHR